MAFSAMTIQISGHSKIQQRFDFREAEVCSQDNLGISELLSLHSVDPEPFASVKRVALVYEASLNDRPRICSTQEAISFFKQYWQLAPGNDQERFVVACLDTKNRVQCVVVVTVGTLDASLVHPREVFKPAFIEGSSSIILSHNHPSGDPAPSREDIAVTDRLTEAGKLLGIDVLDHIVYGDGTNKAISIREND